MPVCPCGPGWWKRWPASVILPRSPRSPPSPRSAPGSRFGRAPGGALLARIRQVYRELEGSTREQRRIPLPGARPEPSPGVLPLPWEVSSDGEER